MKTPNLFVSLLILTTLLLWQCNTKEIVLIDTIAHKSINQDSINCAQKWKEFTIPKDTMTVQLQLGKPIEIINENNKLKITIENIYDGCSAEDVKVTYICSANVTITLQLNEDCVYKLKYPLQMSRLNVDDGRNITDEDCLIYDKSDIVNTPQMPILAMYKVLIIFRKLYPLTATNKELVLMVNQKEKYIVTLFLIKRC
jgi:hypothetical protein